MSNNPQFECNFSKIHISCSSRLTLWMNCFQLHHFHNLIWHDVACISSIYHVYVMLLIIFSLIRRTSVICFFIGRAQQRGQHITGSADIRFTSLTYKASRGLFIPLFYLCNLTHCWCMVDACFFLFNCCSWYYCV